MKRIPRPRKSTKVWCAVRADGTPSVVMVRLTRDQALFAERSFARVSLRKPRPIRQFTLTPVRRKKR